MEINTEKMNQVFTKYHLKGLPFDAVIHHFSEKDQNEHIHDHLFGFTSHVLHGSYIERVYSLDSENRLWYVREIHRRAGESHFVPANTIHEIIDLPEGECYTLITPGKWEQELRQSYAKATGWETWENLKANSKDLDIHVNDLIDMALSDQKYAEEREKIDNDWREANKWDAIAEVQTMIRVKAPEGARVISPIDAGRNIQINEKLFYKGNIDQISEQDNLVEIEVPIRSIILIGNEAYSVG